MVEQFEEYDKINKGDGSVTNCGISSPIEARNDSRGKPNAILHFDIELNSRQKRILEALPDYNSRVIVKKENVSMADLSALTAKTGDEFALFTKGGERLVIRGNSFKVEIDQEEAGILNGQGFTWSGHTHPGTDFNCMSASDGDYLILNQFSQNSSVIYNSTGDFAVFSKDGDQ